MERDPTPRTPTGREYRILVEQAPILIWRSGTDMLVDYFNERWLTFTGRPIEEELGDGWTEGVHEEDLDRCLEIYTMHFERREVFEMEYRLRRHDGEYRWLFDRGAPFTDDDGVFRGYIGSCVDVHARVEAEIELTKLRREELERVVKLLPVCAWCGAIRNDEGYWQALDRYIESQGLGRASHGICDACLSTVDV